MHNGGQPIPIAYVGGSSRSGSTVLAHLIAQAFNGVVVGELKDVWHRGPLENHRCSCGLPFRSCEFWVEVGRRAFGGWDALPLKRLTALQGRIDRIDRFQGLSMLLIPGLAERRDPGFDRELADYRETLAALYRALQAVSGRALVVESSKHPAQMLLLRPSSTFEPHVIHLVRDSRGVAWSFQKHVVRPEVTDQRMLMPRSTPREAAVEWTVINLPFHILWTRGIPRLLVRYESYARHPRVQLRRIGEFLGQPGASDAALDAPSLDFAAEHTLGGNPVRFNGVPTGLKVDEEWRTAMSRRDQLRVGALTLPLLAAYGYLRGRPASR